MFFRRFLTVISFIIPFSALATNWLHEEDTLYEKLFSQPEVSVNLSDHYTTRSPGIISQERSREMAEAFLLITTITSVFGSDAFELSCIGDSELPKLRNRIEKFNKMVAFGHRETLRTLANRLGQIWIDQGRRADAYALLWNQTCFSFSSGESTYTLLKRNGFELSVNAEKLSSQRFNDAQKTLLELMGKNKTTFENYFEAVGDHYREKNLQSWAYIAYTLAHFQTEDKERQSGLHAKRMNALNNSRNLIDF